MSIVNFIFSQENPQNTKKKLNYEILQEITFHSIIMKFLKLSAYLLMNKNF